VNVGDVTDKLDPRTIRGEVPLHQIGRHYCPVTDHLGSDPKGAWFEGQEALITHDTANQLRGTFIALINQIGVNTPTTVGAPRLLKIVSDPRQKFS
jgi:hypothetical protein